MTRKVSVLHLVLILAAFGVGVLFAQQRPADNVSPQLHPHLAKAQRICNQAYDALVEAQGANDFDMEGHAAKAKQLLVEASHQIKEAALAANKEGKHPGAKVPGAKPPMM